ncbi:MAG TPA: protein phosphatase CheZ [Ramlibacter sp.]|jgi:chemotaxis protein CheZ|uniref:protein phosphatase CheZ n=1 Tax=Ramlibacter sp. TaxID=1917967 RepID=UPI002D4D4134|nr:protein phosphatase CheZ [Ramlibacter sp.]HZY19141.1 protein phosphatase CheZ [Ramlibacter sp.]
MSSEANPNTSIEPQLFYQRVGEITRQLHEALRELGYDKTIENSLGALPDARSRLNYIARLTGDAAEKVLNTVDAAQARQAALLEQADRIDHMLQIGKPDAGALRAFTQSVRANAEATGAQLTDIMMAQDFHDLTGQTVRKVVDIAGNLEDALLKLLLEASPPSTLQQERGMLDGPVSDPTNRTDVVANQAQVDDLLESLGF